MKIQHCLLEANSQYPIGGSTVGELLQRKNVQALWSNRSERATIDTVVIHYISAVQKLPSDPYNLEEILTIFIEYGVSSHYLIERSGGVWLLVPEEKKAWHCGGSIMPEPDNRTGVNGFSIGIELVATHGSGFSEEQYQSVAKLSTQIASRWPISSYVGHDMIAGKRAQTLGLRSDVKVDPGPLFEWERFHVLRTTTTASEA